MSKAADFTHETAMRKLREWCRGATDSFVKPRRGTPEDPKAKGFDDAELLEIAVFSTLADDLIHRGTQHFPRFADLLQREFGYVIGFVAHVRQRWHVSRGARRGWVGGMEKQPNGKLHGGQETVRHFMRNPYFVSECARIRNEQRAGALSDHEMIRSELQRRGYSVTADSIKNASRSFSV